MNRRTILKLLCLTPIATLIHPLEARGEKPAKQIQSARPNPLLEEALRFGPPRRSELLVIAGRPSTGKSTLLLGLLDRLTFQRNEQSIFFSLEKSREDLIQRWREVTEHPEAFSGHINTWIYDIHRDSPKEVRTIVETARIVNPDLRYVFIDYLQLMRSSEEGIEDTYRADSILRELKQMAVELNVAVVLAAQLRRDPAQRSAMLNIRGVTDPSPIDMVIRVHRDVHKLR